MKRRRMMTGRSVKGSGFNRLGGCGPAENIIDWKVVWALEKELIKHFRVNDNNDFNCQTCSVDKNPNKLRTTSQ